MTVGYAPKHADEPTLFPDYDRDCFTICSQNKDLTDEFAPQNHDRVEEELMSASTLQISDASFDITYITPEPFEPKPLIADILRTRYCIPDSVFLVEGVDIAPTSKSKRWRAIRLLLGDGELCIQALLSAEMHRLVDRGEILLGSYVKLQQFRVERRPAANSESISSRKAGDTSGSTEEQEQMVYLIVESLVVVGWNNALADVPVHEEIETSPDSVGPGHQDIEPDCATPSRQSPTTKEIKKRRDPLDIDDDFEVMAVSGDIAAHKREEVATQVVSHEQRTAKLATHLPLPINSQMQPVQLTTLRSLPGLQVQQNWTMNVLCVVASLSDVTSGRIPPYVQRRARLADPTTDKQVQLTVFLDPHLFNPKVGSVVLLLGVRNHRFDGGSLNKYVTDRPRPGQSWWYNNPSRFTWCDVDGLNRWWAQKSQTLQT